jgi:hypothetical protein
MHPSKATTKQISVKALAEFMTSSPVRQRKIVEEYKYPHIPDEIQNRLLYYREARDRIAAYHYANQSASWLEEEAVHLERIALSLVGQTQTRFNHNARALRAYSQYFGVRKFSVLDDLNFKLQYADVSINIHPDLHISEKKKEKIIKLDFSVSDAEKEMLTIVTKIMHEGAQRNQLNLPSSAVLYFDVTQGIEYKGSALGTQMEKNVEATCYTISAIWDSL